MAAFFIAFGLLGLVSLLLSFPVLWSKGEALKAAMEEEPLELSGSVLFVSDFQLKAKDRDKAPRLRLGGIDSLVIAGDLFYSPRDARKFGATQEQQLEEMLSLILPPDFSGTVYLLRGKTHDPIFTEDEYLVRGVRVLNLGEEALFSVNGTPVLSFHGHQLFEGWPGGGVSWLAGKLGVPLFLERLARVRFGIPADVWTVSGHSHVPALQAELRTANTGSFAGVPFQFFFRVPVGTGVLFQEGEEPRLDRF